MQSYGVSTRRSYLSILANYFLLFYSFYRGATSDGEESLLATWKECSDELKDCLGSIVLPFGSLSTGLCRHRTLLFKVCVISFSWNCFVDFAHILLKLQTILVSMRNIFK